MASSTSTISSVDTFLQELLTIQQAGSKNVAILGSRHVPWTHQQLVEMLSYALALTGNRILTSGATGTNLAVIRGVLRADPKMLTVILPQVLERQPKESQEQLETVIQLIEHPEYNDLPLAEASLLCNEEIISKCQQLICFAFHDSRTLLAACQQAEELRKIVTLFFLD